MTVDASGTVGRSTTLIPNLAALQTAQANNAAQIDQLFDLRAIDRRDGLTVGILRKPHAVDSCADVGAQLHHVEVFGHGAISGAGGGAVKDLAGRDPNYPVRL